VNLDVRVFRDLLDVLYRGLTISAYATTGIIGELRATAAIAYKSAHGFKSFMRRLRLVLMSGESESQTYRQ